MRKILLFTIMACLLTTMAFAVTGSLGNAKAIIRPDVPEDSEITIERTILVNNKNDFDILITLKPDERMKLVSEIIDSNFTLKPGESANARYRVTLKSGGNYGTLAMGVIFESGDPAVSSPPVGLSSTLTIIATGPINDWYYEIMNASTIAQEIDESELIEDEEEINDENNNNTTDDENNSNDQQDDSSTESDKNNNQLRLILIIAGIMILLLLLLVLTIVVKKLN